MGDAMRRHFRAPRKLLKAHGTVVDEKGRLGVVALVYMQVGTEDKARVSADTETTYDVEGDIVAGTDRRDKTRKHVELRDVVHVLHVYFLREI